MSIWKTAPIGIVLCISSCAPELRTTSGDGGGGASSSGMGGTGGMGGAEASSSSSSVSSSGSSSSSSASSSSSSASSSSSSSGGGGMGPIGTLGQPCPMVGMLGCAGNAQKSQLICGPGFTWQTNGTCGPGLLCDTTVGVNQGTCQSIVAACQNAMPGSIVCSGKDRIECGPDLVTSKFIETCAAMCQAGMCAGECTPGATNCVGNFIRTCDANGMWQTEVPCPSAAPRCIAGQCSDPNSCMGLPKTCGPQGNDSCCNSILVPGGTFNRLNNASYPATVSDYRLDKYEITVGRFRKFFAGYPANKPVAGLGAHPNIAGSGWDPAWDANLPADQGALQTAVQCTGFPTWTASAGANETKPMTCMDWYLTFAFCAWDGGYMPTEAQWNYAAAGGNEQRLYPWGAMAPSASLAVFNCGAGGSVGMCTATDLPIAGSLSPGGDGKFGHSDLAGSMLEWLLDKYSVTYSIANCNDCAEIVTGASRVFRGGDWQQAASALPNNVRNQGGPLFRYDYLGGRCVRRP